MSLQWIAPDGVYTYKVQSNTATLLSYAGDSHYLMLPEKMVDYPLVSLAPKAFLGQKQIEHLTLPSCLIHIGDWAFAHMTSLKTITISAEEFTLGKQVFMDCPSLEKIYIGLHTDPVLADYAASVLMTLRNPLLFRPADIGSIQWFSEFDDCLCRFLSRPDDDGFEPVYLGWFEDEDVMTTQHPAYIQKRRLEKAALTLKRLRFPNALLPEHKKIYEDYLSSHLFMGVWDLLLTAPYLDDCSYLQLLLNLDCVDAEIIEDCITDCNLAGATQAVALLLNYKETHLGKEDFFSQLHL